MMGAYPIEACEIEEIAVENARENASINNVDNVVFHLGDASEVKEESFDIILANINRNVLINSMDMMYGRLVPGGCLVMSGILDDDIKLVIDKASSSGLNVVSQSHREGWVRLTCTKPSH